MQTPKVVGFHVRGEGFCSDVVSKKLIAECECVTLFYIYLCVDVFEFWGLFLLLL